VPTFSKWYFVRLSSIEAEYGRKAREPNLVRRVALTNLVVVTLVVWFATLPAHSLERI